MCVQTFTEREREREREREMGYLQLLDGRTMISFRQAKFRPPICTMSICMALCLQRSHHFRNIHYSGGVISKCRKKETKTICPIIPFLCCQVCS